MEESWRRLGSVLPRSGSVPGSLLAALLVYSFSSQFLPIEPYMVPYLTTVKKFTNYQVTVDIFPVSVYSQLIFTLLMGPGCLYLSHKLMITLGAFGLLISYLIVWFGQSLLAMQIMQMMYGFGMSTKMVFSSYIFLLVTEEEFQSMTSLTTTTSLLSFMLASELSQFLAIQEASYELSLVISVIALSICCIMTSLLPKDHFSSSLSSLTPLWGQSEVNASGWMNVVKETWNGQSLQILSLWWAVAFAGISLVQNYGTNLFDAVDPKAKYNGHILAASQAAGSLGSYCAVFIEEFASKSGLLVYVLGSALMAILCVCLGVSTEIWAAYMFYVTISGIYQTLACLASVRCSRLLSNGQYVLLFSINNFIGLLVETLLQAAVNISGLSIHSQFLSFAGFFFVVTAFFIGLCFINSGGREPISFPGRESESETEHLISNST